jgi:putative pyruvate formate lyase activating enzyme
VFCQNYRISHLGAGTYYSIDELADTMLALQQEGAHNVNLVSPTQYSAQIMEALVIARARGLGIPVVYNTNGYESVGTLEGLEGLVDIYLPDFKYFNPQHSRRYSGAHNYPEVVKRALMEMHRQVGDMVIENGLAQKGLIIRLLLLPSDLNDIGDILKWIRDHLGVQVVLSLMGQYYPTYRASEFPELNRVLRPEELDFSRALLAAYGFQNAFVQEIIGNSAMTPSFRE